MSETKFHAYAETDKIMTLYILISMFLDIRREYERSWAEW
jgi:hypothetical protein